jgi:MFS family permease
MIALRERSFCLYWLGQAVSNTGNWMQVVALGWFVLQVSDAPIALGLLGLVQSIPIFTLSLVGGMLADRFSRLKVLIVTQSTAMVLAVVLALLAAQGKPPLWSLLVVAALAAAVTAIDNPARQAFLSDLVSKEALLNAVALNASVYNGAAVIGPSLGGLILLRVGAAGCFLLNALSFLAVLIALLTIAVMKARAEHVETEFLPSPVQGPSEAHRFDLSLRAFALLRHEYAIIAVLGIAAATSLLGRPYLLLMPAFARVVQHVGPLGLGLMVAASGVGSLGGSLLLASLKARARLERLLAVCGIGFGLVLVVFALTSSFLMASLVLVACGAGATMTMTIANTLLQTQAPTNMRGRIMSLYTLIAAGLTPLGALIVTALGRWIGLAGATVIAGLGVALAIIVGYRMLKEAPSCRGSRQELADTPK